MISASSQRGLSLIGLLIGLLISVLCILASLTLYKTLIRVATESRLDSQHDGQLAAASLVIQMEVQSAGYGIDNAGAAHVIENIPAAGQRQLLWRYNNSGTFECRGLHETALVENAGTENEATYRVLRVIKVSAGCNGTAALNTFNWDTQVSVLGRWRVYDDGAAGLGLDKYIADNNTLFDFTVSTGSCTAFGASAGTPESHLRLQVTVPSSANLQGAVGVGVTQYDYCLANTYPT